MVIINEGNYDEYAQSNDIIIIINSVILLMQQTQGGVGDSSKLTQKKEQKKIWKSENYCESFTIEIFPTHIYKN